MENNVVDVKNGKWLSIKDMALKYGCSEVLIYGDINKGIIEATRLPNGKLIIDEAAQQANFLKQHPALAKKFYEDQRKLNPSANFFERNETNYNIENNIDTLTNIKLRKEKAYARKAEIIADQAEGRLVDINLMQNTWKNVAIRIRKSLLAIPDRIAPLMCNITNIHEAHHILTKELKVVLKNIGDSIISEYEKVENATLEETCANSNDTVE